LQDRKRWIPAFAGMTESKRKLKNITLNKKGTPKGVPFFADYIINQL